MTLPLIAAAFLAVGGSGIPSVMPPALQVKPPALIKPPNSERPEGGSLAQNREETSIIGLMQGSASEKAAAAARLEEHPDIVNPFQLVRLISYLWQNGDKARAAFWYYFWEQRSRPWSKLGLKDGENALRASIRATLGPMINEWAGSDLPAERSLMLRAISYEKRVPLFNGRPDEVDESTWLKEIAEDRVANDGDHIRDLFRIDSQSLAKLADERHRHGLDVGPWENPGRAVPDKWS